MQRSANERRRCTPLEQSTTAILVGVLVALVAAGAVLVPVAAADPGGDTIYVDDDWSDLNESATTETGYEIGTNASATLSGGVSLADPGDIVVVHDGAYDGVRVTKHVHLHAATGATPEVSSDAAAVVQFEGSADGSSLEGFELTGDADLGVEVRGDDVTVTNNTISVAKTGVQVQDDDDGPDGDIATGTYVANNTISGGVVGVSVNGGDTVTNNTITGATLEGVGVSGQGNDVTGNDEIDPAADAPDVQFYGDYSDEVVRANALLDDSAIDSVAFNADGHVYDGSVVADATSYATIQEAIEAASEGETVLVEPGTYQEHLTLDEEGITLEATGARDDTILTSDGTTLDIAAANVTVDGFTVETTASSGELVALGGTNYTLAGNVLDATSGAAAAYGKADDGTLRNNVVKAAGTSNYAIRIGDADGLLVADNEFEQAAVPDGSDNRPQSLLLSGVTDSTVRDNEFTGAASGEAVLVTTNAGPVDNLTVEDNQITAYANGVFLYGDGSAMSNVDAVDNDVDGVTNRAIRALDTSGPAAFTDLNDEDAAASQSDALLAANDVGAVSVDGVLSSSDTVTVAPDKSGDFATIQAALDSVETGTTVQLADGTYDLSDYENDRLDLTTSGITIQGESMDGVILDGTDSPWPVYASNQDDLTLRNFTIVGTEKSDSDDGLKVAFADGLTIENVAVEGSAGNELDLNNVRNATLRNVHAVGQGTGGVGVALTAVQNATLDEVETSGNTWGGVGLYDVASDVEAPSGWTLQQNTTDVTITEASTLTEPVPLYSDQDYGGTLGDVYAPDYEYAVENPTHRDRGPDFQFFFEDRRAAIEYALAVPTNENSTVQALSNDAEVELTETYVVGEGMSVQTAVNEAGDGGTVEVLDGTFRGRVTVTNDVTLSGAGQGETVLFANSSDVRKNHEPTLSVYADATVENLSVVRKVTNLADRSDKHTNAIGIARESDGANTDATVRNVAVELVDETGEDDYGNAVWVNSFNAVDGGDRYQVNATLTNVTVENDGVGVNTDNGIGGAAVATAAVDKAVDLTIEGGTFDGETRGLHVLRSTADLDVSVDDATFVTTPTHVLDASGNLDLQHVLANNDFDSVATVRDDDTIVTTGKPSSRAIYGELQPAVTGAPDGTTVVVHSGTFTEPVNVTDLHDVTVTASADATFQPTSTVGVNRGGYGEDRVTAFRVVDSRNVTVTGLDIDFSEIAGKNGVGSSSPVYGILYWNTSGAFTDATVRNLAVPEDEGGYYEIGFHARAPDRLGDRLNVTVADNEFRELGRVAVNVHEFVRMDIVNNTFRSADDDFGYAIELGSEATGAIRQNDIAGFDTSAASDGSQSAGIYVENAFTWDTGELEKQVLVANNTVRDGQVGVQFGQTYDSYSSDVKIHAQFQDNVVRNNSVAGVIVTDENALAGSAVRVFTEDNTIADNRRGYWVQTQHDASSNGDGDIVLLGRHDTISGNDVGLLVEQPADGDDARFAVQFRYSAFVDNDVAINESTRTAQVDAELNWFGDEDGPSEGALHGDVAYEPFLTAPPGDVADEPGAVQRFGYDLEIPGDGEAHAVGFPADVDETFGEVFGDVENGVVYAYDAADESWTVPSPDAEVNALDAVVVVAQNRTEYTVSVANAEPSGAPGERELEPGWNFVAAPQHGGAGHAFDAVAGAEIERVVQAFEEPDDVPEGMVGADFGSYTMRDSGHVRVGDGPDVSPFSGYWVFVTEDGTLAGAAYPGLALGDVMDVLTTYDREVRLLGGE